MLEVACKFGTNGVEGGGAIITAQEGASLLERLENQHRQRKGSHKYECESDMVLRKAIGMMTRLIKAVESADHSARG